ncbi:MAG: sigma-54-dependent transcriptional regulator [Trichloromonadaceae bacterium]
MEDSAMVNFNKGGQDGFEVAGNVLVVDDTVQNLDLLSEILTRGGFEVRPAKSAKLALMSARTFIPDLILLDIMMPGMDGYEVCRQLKNDEQTRDVPVIFISALEEVIDRVRAFEVGGVDFITKPFQAQEVVARVRTHLALRRVKSKLEQQKAQLEQEIAERIRAEEELSRVQDHLAGILEKKLRHPEVFQHIVCHSEKMRSIFQYIEALACSSEPVLITGESGVGKELIAKAIHDVSQLRGPWVPVNVAGVDDNVFSDTLFGHVRGAFTGADRARAGMIETAAGGTLFLDEIGDLSPVSQVKLLRLLQEKEYMPLGSDKAMELKARIVVATNVNLESKQKSGVFRKDLYFRLCTHHIEIPPLRERPEDIPVLLDHLLGEAARDMGKKKPTPPPELALLLTNYPFPGNIRELRAMVFNAVSVHGGRKLSMDLFKKAMGLFRTELASDDSGGGEDEGLLTFHDRLPTLREAAGLLVKESMRRCKGNQSMAARLLGITQPALSSRLKKL